VDPEAEPTDFRGETVVGGIPFLLGEKVILSASSEERSANSAPVMLRDRVEEVLLRVSLPKEDPPFSLEGGGGGYIFGGRKGTHKTLTLGERGRLRVKVLRRDGRVAGEVEVRVGGHSAMTDESGIAVFPVVGVGDREARVSEPGFHTDVGKVVIKANAEAYVELHQAEGASGEVHVVDAEGSPVAGARLEVTTEGGVRYCLMLGDAQVLGIHTGADGRRTLPGLPPGTAKVTATFGSRRGEGTVTGGGTVEIRLPPVE
jgi:hypothetical protein